jgi:hypothetical protein
LRKERKNTVFDILQAKTFLASALIFSVLFATTNSRAQSSPSPQYRVEAAFLFNFTKFIDWPASAFNSPEEPFVIGILGDDPFGNFIDEVVKDEKVKEHSIKIERYADSSNIGKCHLLFINSRKKERVNELLKELTYQNVLTVSNDDNFLREGGMIQFFTEDNKIRVAINTSATKAAQISVSSKLLALARIYQPQMNNNEP